MRRWLYRILFSLAILIVAVIVIVQVILWTPLPRRIVLAQIQSTLGLRISATNLSTGWLGYSELTDVSLGLPLSDADFLKVKSLKIHHSSLIMLALGSVVVKSIEVDSPVVEVSQDAQGQWNLAQVVALLGRVGGANTPQTQSTDSSIPKLPAISLIDGMVQITDNRGHSARLQPLNLSGWPGGSLVWQYDLKIGDSVALTGKVAPGGDWQHHLTLNVQNLDPLLKNWGVATTYAAGAKAQWDGRLSSGKLIGSLTMDHVSAYGLPTLGDVAATGSVGVSADGSGVTIRPDAVALTTTNAALPDAGVDGGSIVSDDTGIHAQGMRLRALGGFSNFSANYNTHTQAADLNANWSGLSAAKKTLQSGSLTATLREPFAGQPVIIVDLQDSGTIGGPASGASAAPTQWNAKLNLTGQGSSWQMIDWVLTAPQLTFGSGNNVANLSHLSAHISQHLPIVELASLSLPPNATASGGTPVNLTSGGRIDFSTGKWNFDAASGFNASFQDTPVPITVALHSLGTGGRYELKSLSVGMSDLALDVDGSYDTSLPTPVDLHVKLTQTPRLATDAPVQGEVAGDFKIVGALFKEHGRFRPYLTTTGDLRSSDLVVLNHPLGDIDLKLEGTTSTPNLRGEEPGPSITNIHSSDFSLFQAPWDLSINYPNSDGNMEASLQVHHLQLEELAAFAKMKGITGQVVEAQCDAVIPSLSLGMLDVTTHGHLLAVDAAGVSADTVDAALTLQHGILKLTSLKALSGSGTLTTTASVDLLNSRHLMTKTTVDRWPYPLSQTVGAVVSVQNNLDLDLKAKDLAADGNLSIQTDVMLGPKTKLAHAEISSTIVNRTIDIAKVSGNILTGTFDGQAKLNFDRPLEAAGQVTWDNIDGGAVATAFPSLSGLEGKFSGAITLSPARDPRPLEPVRVDFNVATTGAHFRSLQIGGDQLLTLRSVGYLNSDRVVLDHSDLYLAGGVAHMWGRADLRPGAGISTQAAVDFHNFQLDQLAHIGIKQQKPIPGILDGDLNLIRSGFSASQVLAQAHINLIQADLGNFGPISALYNLMHAGGGQAEGRGEVDLAFEQNTLRVSSFKYFNQGIDATGLCQVGPINYSHLGATKLAGQVVGTVRPLKGSRVQVLSDFDQIFSAFQGGLTVINIVNTIDDPRYPSGFITDVGTGLRQLLVGEVAGAKN